MFVGADEAGKGPVLGPMVAAAVRADPETLPEDVDDSKRVPPARREELAAHFRDAEDVTVGVAVVGVERIDDPETDMNALTVAAQVDALAQVVRPGDDVVVDAGDVSESRFADRVRDGLGDVGREVELLAEHGADETHAIVGAASVVAKVERDARIDAIAAEYGEVGSGYPSDPTTREFLRAYVDDHGDLPPVARRSWSTSQDVLAAAEQSSLSEF